MLPSITLLSAVGLIGTTLAATYNVPVDNRSLNELYAAALKEDRKLVVFSGGDAGARGRSTKAQFAARFPGIELDIRTDLSKYHDSRIDRAFLEKTETADIALLQTLHDFTRWKDQDRLLYYKPPTFDDLYGAEKDLDGAYVPTGVASFGNFFYDSSKVQPPTNYAELLDPKWKSKIVVTYPNDDDAIGYLFKLIVEKYGFKWLESFIAQDPLWVRGTATPAYIIVDNNYNQQAAGGVNAEGRVLTITTTGYQGTQNATFLKSISPVAPEQRMSWTQTAAIFASTKRSATSKLFLAWLTSYEKIGQNIPSPFKSIDQGELYASNVTQTSGFRQFMQDREKVEWWKLQFETLLGPAQGPSPLLVYP